MHLISQLALLSEDIRNGIRSLACDVRLGSLVVGHSLSWCQHSYK
jgi:hypothetical protein